MISNIRYSPEALNDLDEIWEYIAVELANPSAAKNTINGIMNAINKVKEFPNAYSPLYFENGLETNYRFVIFENYMAFYRIGKNEMFVDRVLYGKRDYMKILFK